jgi:hypothetical protein
MRYLMTKENRSPLNATTLDPRDLKEGIWLLRGSWTSTSGSDQGTEYRMSNIPIGSCEVVGLTVRDDHSIVTKFQALHLTVNFIHQRI